MVVNQEGVRRFWERATAENGGRRPGVRDLRPFVRIEDGKPVSRTPKDWDRFGGWTPPRYDDKWLDYFMASVVNRKNHIYKPMHANARTQCALCFGWVDDTRHVYSS